MSGPMVVEADGPPSNRAAGKPAAREADGSPGAAGSAVCFGEE
ncbi:hypothetical protein U9R90_03820 [Streptomyces sp. E11-3]